MRTFSLGVLCVVIRYVAQGDRCLQRFVELGTTVFIGVIAHNLDYTRSLDTCGSILVRTADLHILIL